MKFWISCRKRLYYLEIFINTWYQQNYCFSILKYPDPVKQLIVQIVQLLESFRSVKKDLLFYPKLRMMCISHFSIEFSYVLYPRFVEQLITTTTVLQFWTYFELFFKSSFFLFRYISKDHWKSARFIVNIMNFVKDFHTTLIPKPAILKPLFPTTK